MKITYIARRTSLTAIVVVMSSSLTSRVGALTNQPPDAVLAPPLEAPAPPRAREPLPRSAPHPTPVDSTDDADRSDSGDKSHDHLFHPTPRKHMREMSTDRPDTTESPISVDAGHFQLETEVVTMERDEGSTDRTLGSLNLKLGLASWSDIQAVFDVFEQSGGDNGTGDFTLRNKINLWGNDGGGSAMAVMPFVAIPVGHMGSGFVEGGLILPFGFEGPGGWEFGTMLEVDVARRPYTYGMDFVATATAGHDIWRTLAGFAEIANVTPTDAAKHTEVSANSGLVLAVTDDFRLDGGTRVGLSAAAPDLGLFLGGSGRY